VTDGHAVHFAGAADSLRQPVNVTAGEYYRIALTVSGWTAGTLTPRLSGGSVVDGTAVAANGLALDRIQAVTGNTTFELVASADFDGSVDDVMIFMETPVCIDSGLYDYYLEPQTLGGLSQVLPGPLSGPITTQIK
jgi:hypothetical protein